MSKSKVTNVNEYVNQFKEDVYSFKDFPQDVRNCVNVIMGCISHLESVAASKSFLMNYFNSHNEEMKFYYKYKQLLPNISAYRLRRGLNEEYNVAVNNFVLQYVDKKTFKDKKFLNQLIKKHIVLGIKNKKFYDSEEAAMESIWYITENVKYFTSKALTNKVMMRYAIHAQLHCDDKYREQLFLADREIARDVLERAQLKCLDNPDIASEFVNIDDKFERYFSKSVRSSKEYISSRMESGLADYLLSLSDSEFAKRRRKIRRCLSMEYLLTPTHRLTENYVADTNLDVILSEADKLPLGAMDVLFGDEDFVEEMLRDRNVRLTDERWFVLNKYMDRDTEYEDDEEEIQLPVRVDMPSCAPAN